MVGFASIFAATWRAAWRSALIALALAAHAAAQQSGDAATPDEMPEVTLSQLSNYLEQLSTGMGAFSQYNADGTTSKGRVYLSRPWNLRMEYDPPDEISIIAKGRRLYVLDRKSNSQPAQYPLTGTGLETLIAKNVNLEDPELLQDFRAGDGYSEVHVRHSSKLVDGHSELYFANHPITLLGWGYVDGDGQRTTLVLDSWREGIGLRRSLFDTQQLFQ
ncbi:MAG: outer membrane lipoprotein carrier protein LolA [Rhodobacteraceae bacterium]|nr:outer membrane lipoprotein carrier protein LolA [Paracoccaceae bacterium]